MPVRVRAVSLFALRHFSRNDAICIHLHARFFLLRQRKLHTFAFMKKTAPLSIRITPDLKTSLERLAEADKRSLAGYVEIALQAHVDAVDRKSPRGSRK